MGGRDKAKSDFAGQYSIETVDFWLNDPRLIGLSASARFVLFGLSLIALKERRECLPKQYTWAAVGHYLGLRWAHPGRDMVRIGQQLGVTGLIDETIDGRIIVCGARRRRPNLTWKDEGNIDGINGYSSHQAVSSKQEAIKGEPQNPQGEKPEEPKQQPAPPATPPRLLTREERQAQYTAELYRLTEPHYQDPAATQP